MASEPPQQNVADVLGELESVTRSAEESRSSVAMTLPDLAADEAANGHAGPHSEPLKLGTFPILQLQEAPAQVRVREPRWELRIVAAEGFQVLPQVSQELTGRDVLTWKVVPEDVADSAKATLVFIQARLPKNRNADVQWRIVAGCEDVPQIAVPLGQQFLDQYQAVLRRTTDQLKFEVERLRDAGRTSGLPSELKSAFSVSRRAAESQMKLATRVAEVVADANQYASWLDGQFEVHARLRDSSKPDVLLQFGEPDLQDPEPASKEPMDE